MDTTSAVPIICITLVILFHQNLFAVHDVDTGFCNLVHATTCNVVDYIFCVFYSNLNLPVLVKHLIQDIQRPLAAGHFHP
ncbi:MAG: hypothetical protein IIU90_00790, partial [Bacteroidaceae bacterium]|nr:hypothetical protein [Bacteroidaceae bacterium]